MTEKAYWVVGGGRCEGTCEGEGALCCRVKPTGDENRKRDLLNALAPRGSLGKRKEGTISRIKKRRLCTMPRQRKKKTCVVATTKRGRGKKDGD